MNTEESCKCPACSDLLVFDIEKGLLCCPSCGAICDVEKYERALRMKKRPPRDAAQDGEDMACPNCGAVLSSGLRRACAMICPCCGGFFPDKTTDKDSSRDAGADDSISDSAVNSMDCINGIKPDLVIPFAQGREVFMQALRNHSETHPALPQDFLRSISPESIRPAYLPVLVYELLIAGDLSKEKRNNKNKIIGCHAGHFSLNLKGFSEPLNDLPLRDPGGKNKPGSLCLETWDITRARPGRAAWFCGIRDKLGHTAPAEILEARRSPNYEDIKKRIRDLCLWLLMRQKYVRGVSGSLAITPRSLRYVLCPVWLLPVSYHGRTYLSVMNASTGKATISAPRSLLKNVAVSFGFSAFNAGLLALVHTPVVLAPFLAEKNGDLIIT
ncbi:hypothetical protein [Succinimonas sp.]|uniref:hypothetical protein n=1 Tax=Succinimonas sp. TaxID=1936151 RepID=UPI003870EAD7